jgi:hypothetical protein
LPRKKILRKTKKYCPLFSKSEVKKTHGDQDEWWLFSEGVCRNAYMRNWLRRASGYRCACCVEPLKKGDREDLHHRRYDWQCTFTKTIDKEHRDWQRDAQKGESEAVPDCKSCHDDSSSRFGRCAEKRKRRLRPIGSAAF